MILRSLSEWHFMMMIRFGLYFCFSDEYLKLAKPYSKGFYIGWYWLLPAVTKPKGWLRSEIQPLLPPHRSGALERDWINLEGHFFYLPKATIWAHTRLPKVVSKRLWKLLTRAWWSTCPFSGLQNCMKAQGRDSMLMFRDRRLSISFPSFFFSCPHWNIFLFTFQLPEHRHFHH